MYLIVLQCVLIKELSYGQNAVIKGKKTLRIENECRAGKNDFPSMARFIQGYTHYLLDPQWRAAPTPEASWSKGCSSSGRTGDGLGWDATKKVIHQD
jgi:hypothetical protein